jgi:pyridoxal 5'-phosphate synthase pdxT subunit
VVVFFFGYVALQGAFVEHQAALEKLDLRNLGLDLDLDLKDTSSMDRKLNVVLVKTKEDLERCDALIIPGGGE